MSANKTARDYMTQKLITTTPEMDIQSAIKVLLDGRVSGCPVVNATGGVVGVLSIKDCLKVAFDASYHQQPGGPVAAFMSSQVETIEADADIVEVADHFLKSTYRRFPVVADGQLVGQISRYDVLRALRDLW